LIGDTPFGIDFTPHSWPAPFADNAIVATHGAAGSWTGARVVAIAMDPATGLAQPATNKDGMDTGAMKNFATGWDDRSNLHGRPAEVTFSSDGRLFLANDNNGVIVWIAPMTL
jgi:glucose/arabinose dehydrogenase